MVKSFIISVADLEGVIRVATPLVDYYLLLPFWGILYFCFWGAGGGGRKPLLKIWWIIDYITDITTTLRTKITGQELCTINSHKDTVWAGSAVNRHRTGVMYAWNKYSGGNIPTLLGNSMFFNNCQCYKIKVVQLHVSIILNLSLESI